MAYEGPMRPDKAARRLGETKQFANKRKKSRVRAKMARASCKR
jgi:hypothetical protein